MRFALPAALILAASPVLAFDPGTHGEPMEEEGYFVGCTSGEEGGSAFALSVPSGQDGHADHPGD